MDETKRQELLKEKEETISRLAEIESRRADYGSDVDAGDEESHETAEIGLNLGIEQSLKNRLAEIEDELVSAN